MLSTLWNWAFGKDGTSWSKEQKTTCPRSASETIQNGSQDESHGQFVVDGSNEGQKFCPRCKAEKASMRKYRWKLILGLLLPYSLQALDVTIVASALPTIAQYLGQLSQLNWVVAAFNLTSAAFISFWGSAICTGGHPDAFGAFLLGRAIQGIGCAGLNTAVRVAPADRVSLQENARNWTIFTLVAGLSYGFGPAIGGALTSVSWRWCFAINLPIAVVSMLAIFVLLRDELLGPQQIARLDEDSTGHRDRFTKRLATLDTSGQLIFLLGFGLVILSFTWAVKDRNISILLYINLATGMVMYSVLYFVEIYFDLVKHYPPNEAGIQLLLYTPGLGEAVGLGLMAWALYLEHTPTIFGMIALTGVGVGLRFMPFMTTVFNNMTPDNPKNGIIWAFVLLTPFMVIVCSGIGVSRKCAYYERRQGKQ
ncbi:MFS general substrate transporter [Biscogniauxia sp. FL1348]|nr:MFS general substrate transporter [Biscogniauxia sp. FL1348]